MLKSWIKSYLNCQSGSLIIDIGQVDPLIVGMEVISGGEKVVVPARLVRLLPTDYSWP